MCLRSLQLAFCVSANSRNGASALAARTVDELSDTIAVTAQEETVGDSAYERMRQRFDDRGADLKLPVRVPGREPPDLR